MQSSFKVDTVAAQDAPFVPFKPLDISPPTKTRFDRTATSGWCKCRTTILEHCSHLEITRQPARTQAFFNSFLFPPHSTISPLALRSRLARLSHVPLTISEEEAEGMVWEARTRDNAAAGALHNLARDAERDDAAKQKPRRGPTPVLDPRTAFLFPGKAQRQEHGISLGCFTSLVTDIMSGGDEDWEALARLARRHELAAHVEQLDAEARAIHAESQAALRMLQEEIDSGAHEVPALMS